MKKIIILLPFIFTYCGPSQKEINRMRADSVLKAMEASQQSYNEKVDSNNFAMDTAIIHAKERALTQ